MAETTQLPKKKEDLQDLLRLAIACTESEDTNAPTVEQMDPTRKQFLENAIKCISSENEEIKKAMLVLESESASEEQIIDCLNFLRYELDNTDLANNFIKAGGSKTILRYLDNKNTDIRICALYIIAEISQNNPFSQQHFLDAGIIPKLMGYLQKEDKASSSILHALSAIVRNFEPGCSTFLQKGGINCMKTCLQSKCPKVFMKACFLVRTLSTEYTTIRDGFVKVAIIQTLVNCFDSVIGFDVKVETILSTLCVLSECDEGKSHLASTNVTEKINDLINVNSNKPECEDMIEYSTVILQRLKDEKSRK